MSVETLAAAVTPGPAEERLWDPVVRVTHWGVALAVLANGLITEGGSEIHVWIGYAMLGLLVLRLVWGLVGTAEARFAAFPPSVSAAVEHVRELMRGEVRSHRSHNPLGALMVYVFWVTLSAVAVTGLLIEKEGEAARGRGEAASIFGSDEAFEADRAGRDDGDEDEGEEGVIGEIHETAANLLLLLAALHVAGVVLESRRGGVNLARAMVTGRKPAPPR